MCLAIATQCLIVDLTESIQKQKITRTNYSSVVFDLVEAVEMLICFERHSIINKHIVSFLNVLDHFNNSRLRACNIDVDIIGRLDRMIDRYFIGI